MARQGELRVEDVSKQFRVNGSELLVLDSVDLSVAPGEFLTIVGASGCGKSTLLRLIAGLDTDFHGGIALDGQRVTKPDLERGLVFQEPRLFPWLTVAQNVALGLLNAGLSKPAKRRAVLDHIALVGLSAFQDAYPHQLSGGMAQRVAIARGLVNRPGVLLLDEPFGALDALTRARLQDELQRIWAAERITMLLVTHDVEEAVYLGDRVVVMAPRPGRIAASFDVPHPRPRDRTSAALAEVRSEVMAALEATISAQVFDTPRAAPRPVAVARDFATAGGRV
jgi:sulfonate transport system ATP-binding protein